MASDTYVPDSGSVVLQDTSDPRHSGGLSCNSFLKDIGTDLDVASLSEKYSLSEGEIRELILAFRALDSDNSGSFDSEELLNVLRFAYTTAE